MVLSSLALSGLLLFFQSISLLLSPVGSSPIECEKIQFPKIKSTTLPQQLCIDSKGPNSKRRPNDAISISVVTSSLTNRLQRFVQLGHMNRRVLRTTERSLRQTSNGTRQCRTKITFRLPDSSSVWNHLYSGEDGRLNRENKNFNFPEEYNHANVGITNPSIESLYLDDNDYNDNISINYHPDQREIVDSVDTTDGTNLSTNKEVDAQQFCENWWPSSSYGSKNFHLRKDLKSTQHFVSDGWRIRRYTRRVGKGSECYQRVRNAALDWEFHKDSDRGGVISNCEDDRGKNAMGIVQAIPPPQQQNHSNRRNRNGPFVAFPQNAKTNVVQIWSSPGKRKFATYSEFGKLRFCFSLPSLYVINPVAVVYDLIDQRGPGTIFSSTAYGTLGGHWLRGEERVTVAMRNCERGMHKNFDRHTSNGGYVDIEILSYSRPSASLIGRLVWPMIGKMQNAFFLNQLDFLEGIAQGNKEKEREIKEV